MGIQYELACDYAGCTCKTQIGATSEETLSTALAGNWTNVQIQYDGGIKAWWICPECSAKSIADATNAMKNGVAAEPVPQP